MKASHDVVDEVVDWHKKCSYTPSNIPRFDDREEGKTQVLLDTWKDSYE